MAKKKKEADSTLVNNRKARHNYHILETVVAGMELSGPEVKSIRAGQINLAEAYIRPQDGQLWLLGAHISRYVNAGYTIPDPVRQRRLLLHKREIERLSGLVREKGRTLVPLAVFVSERGWLKMLIGLGEGKTHGDKRQDLKARVEKREMEQRAKVGRIKL